MGRRYTEETANIADYMDDEELDAIRAVFAYILLKNTDMDKEMVYSLVFENGGRITWH